MTCPHRIALLWVNVANRTTFARWRVGLFVCLRFSRVCLRRQSVFVCCLRRHRGRKMRPTGSSAASTSAGSSIRTRCRCSGKRSVVEAKLLEHRPVAEHSVARLVASSAAPPSPTHRATVAPIVIVPFASHAFGDAQRRVQRSGILCRAVPCRSAAVLLWPRVARQPVVVVHRKLCYDVRCCNRSGTVQTARACMLHLACCVRCAVCCLLCVGRSGRARSAHARSSVPTPSRRRSRPCLRAPVRY